MLGLLAGCAPVKWQKPGVDAIAGGRDFDACRQQARTLSYQEAATRMALQPYSVGMDRAVTPPASAEWDRVSMEQHYLQMCMRGKGYELKPVERAAK